MSHDLEVSTSEQGELLVRYRKRQLCSFVDPLREAKEWVKHYQAEISLSRSLVLLGLGAGHHLIELRDSFSGEILVVEKLPQLIESIENRKDFNRAGIRFVHLDQFSGIEEFRDLPRPIGVLTFAPAVFSNIKEYEIIYALLRGREPRNISEQFKLRGQEHFFCPDSIDTESPAKMYKRLAEEQSIGLRWQKIFRILGEIIR